VAQQDPEHYLAFTEQLWANQPDEGGAGLSDEEIAALAQQAGVDQGVVDQMPDRPLADWVVASTQYAMQEEGFGGTPRVRMALGDGELMAWQTWYQAYQDDSGQTMVYPGDLDLALANVQAGRSPDDAGGTTNSEDVPDPSLAEGREWTGTIKVADLGDITITLDGVNAPQAVANFVTLAKAGYYDNHSCHRLTTEGIWVVQCGSLTGDGTDTPGYTFGPLENVPSDDVYPRGTIAMARAQAQDSQGAQFFIVYQDSTISGGYTVFGHVTEGMDLIDQVAAAGVDPSSGSESDGPLLLPMLIESITVQ
jgi:peptidyl-prolyl cis-trans isomerase B (cyclophilin B)